MWRAGLAMFRRHSHVRAKREQRSAIVRKHDTGDGSSLKLIDQAVNVVAKRKGQAPHF